MSNPSPDTNVPSETRLFALAQHAEVLIAEADARGHYRFLSPNHAALFGRPLQELAGAHVLDQVHEEDRPEVAEAWARAIRSEEAGEAICRLRDAEGRWRWFHITGRPFRTDGEICVALVGRDISEQRAAEAALRESQRFVSRIAEAFPGIVFVIDMEKRQPVYSNGRSGLLGHAPGDYLAMSENSLWGLAHPEDEPRIRRAIGRAVQLDDGGHVELEYRLRRSDDSWFWVNTRYSVFTRSAEGKPLQILAVTVDVDARRRAIEALRSSEHRHRLLADNAADVLLEMDLEGRITYVSPSWKHRLGHPVTHGRLTDLLRELAHPDELPGILGTLKVLGGRMGRGTEPGSLLVRGRHADGSWRHFDCRGRAYTNAEGEIRVLAICRDVTERIEVETALRASEARLRMVAETTTDLIVEFDQSGRTVYRGGGVARHLSAPTPDDSVVDSIGGVHPEDEALQRARLRDVLAGKAVPPVRFRVADTEGGWRWLESQGQPYETPAGEVRVVAVTRDVTDEVHRKLESERLQEQVAAAQRSESLGVLAGGIAHEFNNLLVGILGNTSLALNDAPADSAQAEVLRDIETSALRAAELTQKMLAFAGKGRFVVEPVDLSRLVRELRPELEASRPAGAALTWDLADALPPIEGDPGQLRQLVTSLLSNAYDALADGRGSVRVATRCVTGSGGQHAELEVSDDGCGMDPGTAARVFEPFFTTKFTGRGLGLAAAQGIVRGHRGRIELDSKPGAGTRFRVQIPVPPSALHASRPRDDP